MPCLHSACATARVVAFLAIAFAPSRSRAEVSIYPYPVPTPGSTYKGWQAYDPGQPLQEPALPTDVPPLDFVVELDTSGNPKASSEQLGSFLGISIEMSLSEPIIGPNSSWLRPQFLNLMSTLRERGGPPVLRLGGNTQEKAKLVDSLPGGAATAKTNEGPKGLTNTPTLLYTPGILEALRASSDILGIQWIMGIPMNDTNPPRLEIMEQGEEILGDYLWGWQLGNEPDLYLGHKYRNGTYEISDYMGEVQHIIDVINADTKISRKNTLGGPSVCCAWTSDELVDTYHYIETFGSSLNSFIIEQYPAQNCGDTADDAQGTLIRFMNHSAYTAFRAKYEHAANEAIAAGKPVVLIETNTASCNGFKGLSDSFASSLFAVDMALQLASASWSHMMLHLGGQAAYYNPFVPPPHNATAPFQWTVYPIMYGILAVAETLGNTGKARVADLNANGGNVYTPAYVVYEDNQPARLMFINYMSDPSGAHDYTARFATSAAQVRARYLVVAEGHVTSKTNVTWAGQSFGGYFESDGLLRGEHETVTIPCSGGSCAVHVPGPSAVLVFLTDSSYEPDDSLMTFATSHTTSMHNTAAVDGLTLQTSNGLDAEERRKMQGSGTSAHKTNAGSRTLALSPLGSFVAGTLAVLALLRAI